MLRSIARSRSAKDADISHSFPLCCAARYDVVMEALLEKHSSELMILALVAMVMASLIVIIPKLLRVHQKNQELRNAERLKALEQGLPIPPGDDRARAAGRTAVLVPCIAVIPPA